VLLMMAIAATAAASVYLYAKWREEEPDLAAQSTKRVQQLAAVVLVLTRAVEGVVDALGYVRPQPAMAGQGDVNLWDQEDFR
jgi:hypothetical protein